MPAWPAVVAATLLAALPLPASLWAGPVGAGVLAQGEVHDSYALPPSCFQAFTPQEATLVLTAWTPGDVVTLWGYEGLGGHRERVESSTSGTPPMATLRWTSPESCPTGLHIVGASVAARAAYVVKVSRPP